MEDHPTPTEASALLRAYARSKKLPPGDNNVDDAGNVIDRLTAALSEEREACAKVADNYAGQFPAYPEFDQLYNTSVEIAATIRSRSTGEA